MDELVIKEYDVKGEIVSVGGVDYVPKAIFDEVIRDRRNLAMEYVKLTKDMADLKKHMRNLKNNINAEKTKEEEKEVFRLKPKQPEPLEEKVYPNWAFTERTREKAKINQRIYEKIREKYQVSFDPKKKNNDEFDIVIDTKYGMYKTEYTVLKNKPKLSAEEIALIVDGGNLCFGYRGDGGSGVVWTD